MRPRGWVLSIGCVLLSACGKGDPGPPANPTDVSAPGRTPDASGPGPIVDAGVPSPMADASGSGPIVDAGTPSPIADASAPSPIVDAGAAGLPEPAAAFIPRATGPCPDFTAGMITVRPGGVARQVRVWIGPAAQTLDGPLVFYWYGTGGSPAQTEQALSADTIAAITAQGGLVVAPVHDPAAGTWPWHLVSGSSDADLRVADEVLACAVEKVGVDRRRIHSLGFSAGAIHTVQMSYRRSGYLASVATYSGGKASEIPDQDPDNKLAAMIFHGGANDRVIVAFQAGSEAYKADLTTRGRFALICNHGMGHRIPSAAVGSVWGFFQRHPFGTAPSPYASALPADVPNYCAR